MKTINFYKIQATGNDFVVLDGRSETFNPDDRELVSKICNRRFGVGADGLLVLKNSNRENCDFEMIYRNSDGSYAEMCGNGARAIVYFAHFVVKLKDEKTYQFHIDENIYQADIEGQLICLEMTQISDQGKFDLSQFPMGKDAYFIDTGVPHSVFFSDEFTGDFCEWAAKIRFSKVFPKGSNVNLVRIEREHEISIRTYERGVEGETLSCGTGVTACALAYAKNENLDRGVIKVRTEGGRLEVLIGENSTILKGPAKVVFVGQYERE